MGRRSARSKQVKSMAKSAAAKSVEARQLKKKNCNATNSQFNNVVGRLPDCSEDEISDESDQESSSKKEYTTSSVRINVLKYARLNKSIKRNDKIQIKKKLIKNLEKANEVRHKHKGAKLIKRRSKRCLKSWKQLTREERCRRLKLIGRLAPGAMIVSAPVESTMTPEATLAMAVNRNLTTRQVAGIRKDTRGYVASNYSVNKAKKNIINDYGTQEDVPTSSGFSIKTFLFEITFLKMLEWFGLVNVPSLQTVVLSVDGGGGVTKAGWYPCFARNPCSEKNFRILSSFEDLECYEYCKAVIQKAISNLKKFQEGCFVNNFFIRVKFILTGDLKFINSYNGLQGCQATFCCPICLIRKCDLVKRTRNAPLRSLNQLREDFYRLQTLIQRAKTSQAIAKAHQDCHSIKNIPMTQYFELNYICPGVMHTLAGALNAICDWAKKYDKRKIDKLFKDSAVYPQGHTKKLTGNHGRILLNKLSNQDVHYDGKGATMLFLLADIQQYSIAEILSEEKIAELHDCIDAFANELDKPEYDEIAKSSQHIHMLIAHVLSFVVEHKSWGIYSDQPGEAIHKTQKRYYNRIPKRSNNANSSKKSVNRNDYFVGQTILQNKFSTNK